MRSRDIALYSSLLLLSGGCGGERQAPPARAPQSPAAPVFSDATAACGIDFVHYTGATGAFFIPEIMGPGCALFDCDGDGDLDIYVVQGALLEEGKSIGDSLFPPREAVPRNRLFRNDLDASRMTGNELLFTDVTEESGVGHTGCGMGVATGDYDNDGHPDLYVTNFGSNVLYHNDGDGTFTDVTREAGADDPRFSASTAFLDYDRDGHLDLFVTNYVDFSTAANRECTRLGGQRDYCGPLSYEAAPDSLFHNDGDGTFTDVTTTAGLHRAYGNGLGVVCADFDGDGWVDIFVANDATPNQLWINRRDGTFTDEALLSGVAVNASGQNEAGMGVCTGDFDRDGDEDLFLTHEMGETNTFYRNLGEGLFEDATVSARLADPSLPFAGFGTGSIDYDGDGWLDVIITNGAVRKLAALAGEEHPYRQGDQLYRNVAGRFVETTSGSGLDGPGPWAGRGAAFGDVDNDGDIDVLVANNNGPLRLLLNVCEERGNWIRFSLRGNRSGRDAFGSRVALELEDGIHLSHRVGTDGSYLSASDRRVHFGLGTATDVKSVTVRWSSGGEEKWGDFRANAEYTLAEGEGARISR